MVRAYRVPDLREFAVLVLPAHVRVGSIKDRTIEQTRMAIGALTNPQKL